MAFLPLRYSGFRNHVSSFATSLCVCIEREIYMPQFPTNSPSFLAVKTMYCGPYLAYRSYCGLNASPRLNISVSCQCSHAFLTSSSHTVTRGSMANSRLKAALLSHKSSRRTAIAPSNCSSQSLFCQQRICLRPRQAKSIL